MLDFGAVETVEIVETGEAEEVGEVVEAMMGEPLMEHFVVARIYLNNFNIGINTSLMMKHIQIIKTHFLNKRYYNQ